MFPTTHSSHGFSFAHQYLQYDCRLRGVCVLPRQLLREDAVGRCEGCQADVEELHCVLARRVYTTYDAHAFSASSGAW